MFGNKASVLLHTGPMHYFVPAPTNSHLNLLMHLFIETTILGSHAISTCHYTTTILRLQRCQILYFKIEYIALNSSFHPIFFPPHSFRSSYDTPTSYICRPCLATVAITHGSKPIRFSSILMEGKPSSPLPLVQKESKKKLLQD